MSCRAGSCGATSGSSRSSPSVRWRAVIHTLVVPRVEVDHWIDLDAATWQRVGEVTQIVGRPPGGLRPATHGTAIAGFEAPHCHVHVVPLRELADLDFSRVDHDPDPAALDDAAERIRAAVRELGHGADVR